MNASKKSMHTRLPATPQCCRTQHPALEGQDYAISVDPNSPDDSEHALLDSHGHVDSDVYSRQLRLNPVFGLDVASDRPDACSSNAWAG